MEWSSGVVALFRRKLEWSSGVVELSYRKVEWSSGWPDAGGRAGDGTMQGKSLKMP